MMKNKLTLEEYRQKYLIPSTYHITSLYKHENLHDIFYELKANVADLNKSNLVNIVQGTEEDFIHFMNQAKNFLINQQGIDETDPRHETILKLFSDCIFGYYILTPLIEAEDVSDVKVYAWDRITCKAYGDRYVSDLKFESKTDFEDWIERYMRIHHEIHREDNALIHFSDTKAFKDYNLRVDIQLPYVVSSGDFNCHVRKIPKEKYTWEYLLQKMLNQDIMDYIMQRMVSGYSFLISGVGGSGKTSLLNNMIDLVPFNKSILISQESDELYSTVHSQLQTEHTYKVKKRGQEIKYSLADELRLGLLQDIDVMVVGEMKGEEALDVLITALNTGAVFMGTTHSNSARLSTNRLVDLAMTAKTNYTEPQLTKMVSRIKISLIHLSHFHVDEIEEVSGWDNEKECLTYKTIYRQ